MSTIVLINPPIPFSFYKTPCLSLGYVGASLKKAGHDITIIDGCLAGKGLGELANQAIALRPDYVGITGFTLQYTGAKRLFSLIKSFNPNIITVFGGPHASALTEYVMSDVPEIDFTIRGEGEVAFAELVKSLNAGNENYKSVAGLAYRANGTVAANPPRVIDDLDTLQYPWDVTNPLDYPSGLGHGFMVKRRPVAPIMSSRGCPYSCTFCSGSLVHGKRLRLRNPQAIVDEIEYLMTTFGIREVSIIDDNFTFDRTHAVDVCEEILRRKLDIVWSLPNGVRADRADYALLKLMKEAGCYYLAFGIEFGSERMLKITKKQLSPDKARQAIKDATSLRLITQGFFLTGHPEEKREDTLATARVARSLPLDRISMNTLVPLPGSEVFDYCIQTGRLDLASVDWDSFEGPLYIPKSGLVPYEELMDLLRRTYIQFYANPHRILRYLAKLRSIDQARGLWFGMKTLFRSTVRREKWIQSQG